MDTIEEMLSMLLDGAAETLDISPDLHNTAVESYEEVGAWLADRGMPDWRIYPQGSFLLGTVVRPNTPTGEYDIDLVCWLPIAKDSTSQAELKERVGRMLHAFVRWKRRQGDSADLTSCTASRRAWTLSRPGLGFHMDVLPTIADLELPPTGILLTDKELRAWQRSNPIGYAKWFKSQSALSYDLIEAKRHAQVAAVPEWEVRSTLQRLVQILKWHAMLYFADDCDNRPPSILITTLVGLSYRGERDLFTGARNVLDRMDNFIERRDGDFWIPNPAHHGENFADKWNEYPARRKAFVGWRDDIRSTLDDLARLQGKGLGVIASRMSESFAPEPVERSVRRYGERLEHERLEGRLRMSTGGLLTTSAGAPSISPHTFYGAS